MTETFVVLDWHVYLVVSIYLFLFSLKFGLEVVRTVVYRL